MNADIEGEGQNSWGFVLWSNCAICGKNRVLLDFKKPKLQRKLCEKALVIELRKHLCSMGRTAIKSCARSAAVSETSRRALKMQGCQMDIAAAAAGL